MTCVLAWAVALLLLPVLVLFHLTKSKPQRVREMRQRGWTWKQCADRYGVSATTARRWAMS